jgi:Sugar (and other) transporter
VHLTTCLLDATAVLLMALYPLLPESPHYLAVNGRLLEAQDVLHRISHWNGRPLPPGQLVADKTRRPSAGERKSSKC